MSLKWIFALLVVVYSFNTFASEIEFSKLIASNYRDQLKTASEIQDQVGVVNTTPTERTTTAATESASPKDFNIHIRNRL